MLYDLFSFVLFSLILWILYKYFSRNVNFWKDRGVKGPDPLPLLGNILDNFRTSVTELELQRAEKYGKIYGFFELIKPVFSTSDIEYIKLITMKDFNCFPNRANMTPGDPFLSKLLMHLEDEEWKRVRYICTPSLTQNKVRQMFQLINKVVKNIEEYFEEIASEGKQIELQKTFSSYAVDTIAATVFGVESNSFKDPDGEYAKHASKLVVASSPRVLFGLMMPNAIRNYLGYYIVNPESCDYFKKIVQRVIYKRRGPNKTQNNLLTQLLAAEMNDAKFCSTLKDERLEGIDMEIKTEKRKLDEDEILAQSITMVVAGTETISTTLMYLMFVLATEPEIQTKLYDELNDYFVNKTYDLDSLMALPYLNAVVNETFRRYNPVVHVDRVSKCDYELGNTGIIIPKDTIVNIPIHAIHNDPDYWEEPIKFIPERFMPENREKIIPFSFAPFGYGPRICLGMRLAIASVKTVISNIIYRFEVLKTDKTPTKPNYCGKKFTSHCKPIFVLLKKRN